MRTTAAADLDRLYALLPRHHRREDVAQGEPLRALLRLLARQVDVVEDDIAQLYDNWFVETAEDWVVPYLAELIGYRPVHELGAAIDPDDPGVAALARVLVPRREVANTVAYRRRKGTLTLLEQLSRDVAGWPARAVAYGPLTAVTQHLESLWPARGRTIDLRDGGALERLGGPFDPHAHTPDVRRVGSLRRQGLHNLPHVAVFVWRLQALLVDRTPGYCVEAAGPRCYTFSILGNDAPLYQPGASPATLGDPPRPVAPVDLPLAITRRAFEVHDGEEPRANPDHYGPEAAFAVWAPDWPHRGAAQPVPIERIVPADMSDWHYDPAPGRLAVDPELGRFAFPRRQLPRRGVRVRYHYAAVAELGGGSYLRVLTTPDGAVTYRVRAMEPGDGEHPSIGAALQAWRDAEPRPPAAVIEIQDSQVYTEALAIELDADESLQLRAANRQRPVLRLLDYLADRSDPFLIRGDAGSRVTVDGLLVVGRGIRVAAPDARQEPDEASTDEPPDGPSDAAPTPLPDAHHPTDLCQLRIRHCTLVPGWSLDPDCSPRRSQQRSIVLAGSGAALIVEASIVGSIEVDGDAGACEPAAVRLTDSILDATDPELPALSGAGDLRAHARLHLERSTVFGEVLVHQADRIDTSIVVGRVDVARRRRGCVRYSAVPHGSRTPRRYRCQPDLAEAALRATFAPGLPEDERQERLAALRLRLEPRFDSRRYGRPAYARLAASTAVEIREGAEDSSEMGVHHDLYEPQRRANLDARLLEFTPAGFDVGVGTAD